MELETRTLVLVVGMWGGGTSAVAAVVDALGAPMGEPSDLFRSNDPRTSHTWEDKALASTVRSLVEMPTMKVFEPPVVIRDRLRGWWHQKCLLKPLKVMGAKYPGAAVLLPEFREAVAPGSLRVVWVGRPWADVQETARRRSSVLSGWGPEARYKEGWERVQGAVCASDYQVHYEELIADPESEVERLNEWLGYDGNVTLGISRVRI